MVEKRESKEARKIGFFTSKMQLTTVESQNFWPLVNEMEAELKVENLMKDWFSQFRVLGPLRVSRRYLSDLLCS